MRIPCDLDTSYCLDGCIEYIKSTGECIINKAYEKGKNDAIDAIVEEFTNRIYQLCCDMEEYKK